MENKTQGELVVYRSRIILICFSIISVLVSLAVVAIAKNSADLFSDGRIQMDLTGIIILIVCLLVFIWSLYRIFSNKPVLIVNQQFLYIPKFGNIGWDAIEKVGIKSSSVIPDKYAESVYIMSVPLIFIYLKDGRISRLNRSLYSTDPIDVIRTISEHHEVVYLKDGSKFTYSVK